MARFAKPLQGSFSPVAKHPQKHKNRPEIGRFSHFNPSAEMHPFSLFSASKAPEKWLCDAICRKKQLFPTSRSGFLILHECLHTGFFAGGFLVGCLSYGGDLCNLRGSSVPMACSAVVEGTSGAFAYLFGGLAAYRSIRLGFVCQIGLYLTAGLYALLAMPETRQPEKKTGGRWPVREANPFLSLVRLRHIEPWQTAVFWSILIAACGGWMFESAFNYSISAFFSFSPLFNGVLKCGVGILNALVGAGVIRRLVRRGTIRGPLLLVGVLCMAASLLSACSTDRAILFFPFSVCFLLINSLNLPLHQALLTTNKANLPVGELMGLFNAFRSIGQVAGSMVSGFSYTVGHALPFFCASAFFMMMVFILRWGTSGERKRHANGGIKRRKKNG